MLNRSLRSWSAARLETSILSACCLVTAVFGTAEADIIHVSASGAATEIYNGEWYEVAGGFQASLDFDTSLGRLYSATQLDKGTNPDGSVTSPFTGGTVAIGGATFNLKQIADRYGSYYSSIRVKINLQGESQYELELSNYLPDNWVLMLFIRGSGVPDSVTKSFSTTGSPPAAGDSSSNFHWYASEKHFRLYPASLTVTVDSGSSPPAGCVCGSR